MTDFEALLFLCGVWGLLAITYHWVRWLARQTKELQSMDARDKETITTDCNSEGKV